ncbi:hypothetical protein HOY80DRAFT_1107429 [Tuber brumale]|nr:hypothetical protein HOY80DRAFT_1107429 [Tuber brumale]
MTERRVEKCRLEMDNRVWSVLFLEPQAFKPVSNIYQALGRPVPAESQMSSESPPQISPSAIDVEAISTDYYDPVTNSQAQLSRMAKHGTFLPTPEPTYRACHRRVTFYTSSPWPTLGPTRLNTRKRRMMKTIITATVGSGKARVKTVAGAREV